MSELFTTVFVHPTFNILLVFVYVFTSWGLSGALGWAILSLSALSRIVLNPVYKKQSQMAVQMELLRPEIEELQKKYKEEPQKLQQEQMKLYQKHGLNPASSCLLGLIQIPIGIALFQVLIKFLQSKPAELAKHMKEVAYVDFLKTVSIDPHFFGFNLSIAPSHYQQVGIHYLLLPLITAGLQYVQITRSMPQSAVKKTEKKPEEQENFQAVFQKQMKIMFPIMVGYFSYILPSGLAIYWNVLSVISILQAPSMVKKHGTNNSK